MIEPLFPIPETLRSRYTKLRIVLWLLIVSSGGALLFSFLFPTIDTTFDFRNPRSSKNTITDPRSPEGAPRLNGKVEASGTLIAHTSVLGDFSRGTVSLRLEKQSAVPEYLAISLRRTYRAALFPIGPALDRLPASEDIVRSGSEYYLVQNGAFHRFVSEAAFRSRFPESAAREAGPDELNRLPLAEDFVGFRVGSLLSFADGVFVVTSETEIRPIGSAEIFLALGYRFEDVLPVSEEDIGIYERGRIFLLGLPHPDGTLLLDTDTDVLYVVEGNQRRPVSHADVRRFLEARQTPITFSSSEAERTSACTAHSGWRSRLLSCSLSLDDLRSISAPDYELTLSSPTAIDINTLSLSLETRPDERNMRVLLAKVKQRILNRFGLTTP
jgi:hypothetical protein